MSKSALRLALLRALGRLPLGRASTLPAPASVRVLLIRPDHLGDILFLAPALRRLRAALPDAHLTLLVGPWAREAAERSAPVDEVLTCPFPWFDRRPKGAPWAPYLLLMGEAGRLRDHRFQLAVNFRFDFWWGALLTYVAGVPERVGYDVAECRPFLTQAIPYSPGRHQVEQNLALVEAVVSTEPQQPEAGPLEVRPSPQEEGWAQAWLGRQGVSGPLVALHPGAGAPVKLWPTEKFAQLGAALASRYGATLLLTGTPEERGLVEEVTRGMEEPPLVLLGATLGQLAAVLRRCRLVMGADSGVLHLAVAVGTPTVHLYGPVSSATFGPWGDPKRHRVVLSRLPCVPCNRLDYQPHELDQHPCIRLITVDEVLAAVEGLLDEVEIAHRH